MKKEVIYEKKYPRIDYLKVYEDNAAEARTEEAEKKLCAEEFLSGLRKNTRYIPIPKRIGECERFIKEAIEVSKLYEINLNITQYDDCICAHFSLDFGGHMKYINRLFGMADEISFFNDGSEFDMSVDLDFYTHVVERCGVSVAP